MGSGHLMAAVALVATCGQANAQEMSYRLPRATLFAGFHARLERCPTADDLNSVIVTDAAAADGNSKTSEP